MNFLDENCDYLPNVEILFRVWCRTIKCSLRNTSKEKERFFATEQLLEASSLTSYSFETNRKKFRGNKRKTLKVSSGTEFGMWCLLNAHDIRSSQKMLPRLSLKKISRISSWFSKEKVFFLLIEYTWSERNAPLPPSFSTST